MTEVPARAPAHRLMAIERLGRNRGCAGGARLGDRGWGSGPQSLKIFDGLPGNLRICRERSLDGNTRLIDAGKKRRSSQGRIGRCRMESADCVRVAYGSLHFRGILARLQIVGHRDDRQQDRRQHDQRKQFKARARLLASGVESPRSRAPGSPEHESNRCPNQIGDQFQGN